MSQRSEEKMQNSSDTDFKVSAVPDLDAAYREMAQDTAGEAEALEWIEGTLHGIEDETAEEDSLPWQ